MGNRPCTCIKKRKKVKIEKIPNYAFGQHNFETWNSQRLELFSNFVFVDLSTTAAKPEHKLKLY